MRCPICNTLHSLEPIRYAFKTVLGFAVTLDAYTCNHCKQTVETPQATEKNNHKLTTVLSSFKRFDKNPNGGRDLGVGDIHGHFAKLSHALKKIGFDPSKDRLFSVGDLVDRGPESLQSIDWLDLPYFYAVRGNHDDYVVRHNTCNVGSWLDNGGKWFVDLSAEVKDRFQKRFSQLPLVIEVDTDNGPVGIMHADYPAIKWISMGEVLASHNHRNYIMWSRDRFNEEDQMVVEGIRAIVVGHQPMKESITLGNVHYIDTKGWKDNGYFTFIDLSTLERIRS